MVAQAFAAWVHDRDPKPLRALYDQGDPQTEGSDHGYAVYLGVQCTDAPWPTSWRTWTDDNWRMHRIAPFETWATPGTTGLPDLGREGPRRCR